MNDTRVADLLTEAVASLETAGISGARLDAELLLGHCLEKTRTELYLGGAQQVEPEPAKRFAELVQRRQSHEPVAYILGEREFWSLPFHVTPDVLIPRPETEFLLETILSRRNRGVTPVRCLDLCCGSGVIGIILALELGGQVTAADTSAGALEVARRNCLRHGVLQRVDLVRTDLGSCFKDNGVFSLIGSNPPYIRRADISTELEPDVSRFEPHLALDGGESGLEVVRRICDQLPGLLGPGGDCFIEIGDGQGGEVVEMFRSGESGNHYKFVEIFRDYGDRERVVHVRKN